MSREVCCCERKEMGQTRGTAVRGYKFPWANVHVKSKGYEVTRLREGVSLGNVDSCIGSRGM